MYIILQIPMLDTRYFLESYNDVFFNPSEFPDGYGMPFYRGFGQVLERRNGYAVPLSYRRYVESKKAIKFNEAFGKNHLVNVTKRMYVDKEIVYFEIGVKTNLRQSMDYNEFINLCKKLLCDKMFKEDNRAVSFQDIFPYISEKYELATTYKKYFPQLVVSNESGAVRLKNRHVLFGKPIIFVEYSEHEIGYISSKSLDLSFAYRVPVKYHSIRIGHTSTGIWFIQKGKRSESEYKRQVRISLARIYHEQMSMEMFIRWFESNSKNSMMWNINKDETTRYIDKLLKAIRKQKDKVEGHELFEKAIEVHYTIFGQGLYDALELLKDYRDKLMESKRELRHCYQPISSQ